MVGGGTNGRVERARQIARERGLDGILVTHPANRRYLSGYTAGDELPDAIIGALFIDATNARLLSGRNNLDWARSEAEPNGFEVEGWSRPWSRSIADEIKRLGWSRVGFEDGAIVYRLFRDIEQELGGAVEFVELGEAVYWLRSVKDAAELARYERIAAIGDAAFVEATAGLEPGMTERQLKARIDDALIAHGADAPSFETIVASGPHAARPHHDPGDRPMQAGEPIIIDMGAALDGYHGDLTRTIWIGEPSDRLREVYAAVQAAQDAGIARMKPGVPSNEPDAAARGVVEAAGFGEYFIHGLGHGVGLYVHELPSMSAASTTPLRRGEVITIEPGVYIPDWGGVRIEDLGVIEDDGFRSLSQAPKLSVG